MSNLTSGNSEKTFLSVNSPKIIDGKLDYHDCYPEEQLIYQHLLNLVGKESPNQILDRIRALFIEAANYP